MGCLLCLVFTGHNHTGCDAFSWGGVSSWLPHRCYLKKLAQTRPGHGNAKGFISGSGTSKPLPPRPAPPPPPTPPPPLPFDTAVTVDVTGSTAPKPFEHYWKKSFGSGHASLTLRSDWQAHLKLATEQLGLSGVRHHGLLDDDMGVVVSKGRYNFTKVLQSWGYQRSVGVTPIVELSFMPAVLAGCSWTDPAGSRPGHSARTVNPGRPPCKHTGMRYKGIQQVPTDWEDWYDLVKALAQAAVDAYGIAEVRTWNFECWNELWGKTLVVMLPTDVLPASSNATRRGMPFPGMPFPGTYMKLYNASSHAIKAVDSQLRVGGPATMQLLDVAEFHGGGCWLRQTAACRTWYYLLLSQSSLMTHARFVVHRACDGDGGPL